MSKRKSRYLIAALIIAAVLLPGVNLAQQRGSAGLYGKITDPAAGVVPGASVTLTHLATNQARTTISNEEGYYVFSSLPVGEYSLTVELPGFTRFVQRGILLQVNDNVKVDVRLQLGEMTETVIVEAHGVTVEASNATIKQTVDSRRITELPLDGRNVADLTLLVPGVTPASGQRGDASRAAYSAPGAKAISVNGSRHNNVKYTLDGGDHSDNLFNENLSFPFPDAVQEFSFQTSNAGMEIGKSSAGAVNVVTKSGTNELHGNVFWYLRNTALNANSFFSRAPDGLKRNQGGFTLGGPVIKEKLFFFGGFQRTWLRQTAGDARTPTMPAPFRQGDFSSLSPGIVIRDPATGQPFPNNIIPSTLHSPAAQAVLRYSPLPDPDGFARYSLFTQAATEAYLIRGDYRPSDYHNFLVRYLQDDYSRFTPMIPNNIHSAQQGLSAFTKNATVGYTLLGGPNLVVDTRATMARQVGNRTLPFPETIRDLGVNVNPSSNEIRVHIVGTSNLNLSTTRPATFARTNIEVTNSWRWVKGKHDFVWGAEVMWSRYNEYNVFNGSGVFRFSGEHSGFDQADYILGLLSEFQQSNGEIEFRRRRSQGFYMGDTYRVAPTLTLNLGLRWEPYTGIWDLNDRSAQFRQPEYVEGIRSPHFVNAPPGLFFPGDVLPSGYRIPKAGTESDLNNLAPRIGFAWDVRGNSRTSIRGGYGIYYDQPIMWLLNNMNTMTPFSFNVLFRDGRFDDPYRGRENFNVFPFGGDFDPNTPFQIPFDMTSLQEKFLVTYTQNWNLTVERRLGADWLVRAGYVGTKGTHLMADYDQNAPVYDFARSLQENQRTIDQRRPRPEYGRMATLFTGPNQIYNSLQASVNKRFSRSFTLLTSYTWSKNIDYNSVNNNVLDNMIVNPFDFFYGRGVADNDRPHRFVTSYVWALPGERADSPVLSTILRDWQLTGIVTLQSGRPFSIFSAGNRAAGAAAGGNSSRTFADQVGNLHLPTDRSRGEKISQYFNTSAVVQTAPGTFGNLGRNVLRGPGYANFDMSLSRSIRLRYEETALSFRFEAFNLFNRPHLGLPRNIVGPVGFGEITSTEGDPRILQFSLKVVF